MKFTEQRVRSILHNLIDDDPLACRGVLGLCAVQFTDEVPTACVSLGDRSVLRISLGFLNAHCAHEDDVRFILLHEFLHVLLRHTRRFKRMTPRLNVALDVVINTTLFRSMTDLRTSFLRRYYHDAPGLARLLGPPTDQLAYVDRDHPGPLLSKRGQHTAHFRHVHAQLYSPFATHNLDDVLAIMDDEVAEGFAVAPHYLLGDHSDQGDGPVPTHIMRHLEERALPALDRAQGRRNMELHTAAGRRWRADLRVLLHRLVVPDPRRAPLHTGRTQDVVLPVLNPRDRRAVLRSTWSPFLPDSAHRTTTLQPHGTVRVYLDVSGSMDRYLPHLLAVLAEFRTHLALPLYAFSTEVVTATFQGGKLNARTTGGTELRCVYQHLEKCGATKALVLTDGYVENGIGRPPCTVEALVPHDGYANILTRAGIPVTHLPKME